MKKTHGQLARDLNEALATIQELAGALPDQVATSRTQGLADAEVLLEGELLEQLHAAIAVARELAEGIIDL